MRIAAWLEGTTAQIPSSVFEEPLLASPLRPLELRQVLDDSGFNIKRWNPNDKQAAAQTTSAELINMLRGLMPVAEQVHAEFKIIRIDTSEDEATTLIRCHFSAANSKLRVQQNAAWNCRWTQSTTDKPRIASIELVQFEEIQSRTEALFADRTHAVFRHEPCFAEQLAYPIDHWRDRLDW